MEFTHKPPTWNEQGVEPTADLQANGFKAGYKPPAPYFNYLFYKYMECIKELQTAANTLEKTESDDIKAVNDSIKNVLADHQKDIDLIYDVFTPTIKAYGENYAVKGSAALPLVNMKLFGKTEQYTTVGNQLADFEACNNSTGVTFTFEDDVLTVVGDGKVAYQYTRVTITDIFKANGGKTLYFWCENLESTSELDGTPVQLNIVYTDDSRKFTGLYTKEKKQVGYTIPEDTSNISAVSLALYPTNNATATANTLTFTKPQLQFSKENIGYEKFSGGQPSPSPQYPQPLESKGKWGNLLENTATSQTIEGITYTVNKDKSVTANGTATGDSVFAINDKSAGMTLSPNKYKLMGCPSSGGTGGKYTLQYWGNVTGVVQDLGSGISLELTGDDTNYNVSIVIHSGVTMNNATFYPMIVEADSGITSYRPYSGQMEIESVVGTTNFLDYEEWKKTPVVNGTGVYENNGVTLTSKETKDCYTMFQPNYAGVYKFPCVAGKNYVLSWEHSGSHGLVYIFPNGLMDGMLAMNTQHANYLEYIPTEGITFFTFRFGVTEANSTAIYKNIQINIGKKREFTPYSKQSHISLVSDGLKGIPVTDASLATYTDENGQMWCADYVDCEIQKRVENTETRVFDGSDDEEWYVSETDNGKYAHLILNTGSGLTTHFSREALCSHYIKTTQHSWKDFEDKTFGVGNNDFSTQPRFIIRDDVNATTVENWKAFLAENPITLMYRSFKPIETPLSASEIESFKALHSNYKVTSVMNDCEAYTETEVYAEMYEDALSMPLNRIASIEKTMSNIEAQLAELTAATLALSQE